MHDEPPTHVFDCARNGCDLAVTSLLQRARGVAERSVSLASAADREDAIQKSWISVWTHLVASPQSSASFAGRGSFDAWVRTIATNGARSVIRHQSRKSAPELGLERAAAPSSRFTSAYVNDMQTAAAVSSLPDGEFDFYVLRQIAGLSHAEIAERSGVSIATAKRRIQAARGRVQRNLTRADPDRSPPTS